MADTVVIKKKGICKELARTRLQSFNITKNKVAAIKHIHNTE